MSAGIAPGFSRSISSSITFFPMQSLRNLCAISAQSALFPRN